MLALINDSKQYGFRQNNRFISLDCIHYSNGNTFFSQNSLRKKTMSKTIKNFDIKKLNGHNSTKVLVNPNGSDLILLGQKYSMEE